MYSPICIDRRSRRPRGTLVQFSSLGKSLGPSTLRKAIEDYLLDFTTCI